ncbi:hypothetical protein CTI12_AA227000 [Artemisia annua]|uniref:Uncharacterized protein n=1 Tax=Artemisia annua TaxID=35608 RepID=A0A2U1NU71_ARTAN|nr:hypothetical protein CTI12_AA227000 [Artemisia annua]
MTGQRAIIQKDEVVLLTSQMDESNCNRKEPKMSIKNTKQLDSSNVEYIASPRAVKKDIAEKLYQVLQFCESNIIQEIDKCKKDEIRIKNEIMLLSSCDKRGERKKQPIKNLEEALREVKPPIRSIPRTTGFLHLTKKYEQTPNYVGTDKKRCHNRVKKGQMDFEYFRKVQEELLLSMRSDKRPTFYDAQELNNVVHGIGAQELNYVMESLVHRIQHGNNNRAEEAILYHEIRNLNDTIEIYTAPTRPADTPTWAWEGRLFHETRRLTRDKQYRQHKLKIVLNQLEKAHTVRRGQLNLELDLLRKNIRCMEKLLEKISLRRMKAYKCAYKLEERQNEVKSSYTEYKSSLMTYVKELARRGDIVELMQVCDRQL